ncbi:MAG: ATPase [Legionellales bacterium RIFCSPHIGHO2_12_FULL_35_11]|nr:MAG: ATPase [Legionellales bacterium RIFCSPHIGHO2_12_FULL_35_11]
MNINAITEIVNKIIEPSTKLSIENMGIKPRVVFANRELPNVSDDEINVYLEIGFPCKHLQNSLLDIIKQELYQNIPNHTFNIFIEQKIKTHRTQLPGKGLRNVKNVIAVGSGKGGVGKSTLTVNLAVALAKSGARVGILDADIYGPSIPTMLGKNGEVEIRNDRYLPVSTHGIQAMSIGYLTKNESALIWRGPMLAKSLIQMLDITMWDNLDYLFIDLPPGTGDIQLSLVQKIPLAGAIIVTTPQNIATQDARKAMEMFEKTSIYNIGLIENMSQHVCTKCGNIEDIFGCNGAINLANEYGSKLLGQIPLNKEIGLDCDNGSPSAGKDAVSDSFIQAAIAGMIELSKRPLNYADKFPHITATSRQI